MGMAKQFGATCPSVPKPPHLQTISRGNESDNGNLYGPPCQPKTPATPRH